MYSSFCYISLHTLSIIAGSVNWTIFMFSNLARIKTAEASSLSLVLTSETTTDGSKLILCNQKISFNLSLEQKAAKNGSSCSVALCSSHKGAHCSDLSFHRFPRTSSALADASCRQTRIHLCKKESGWTPTEDNRICIPHFRSKRFCQIHRSMSHGHFNRLTSFAYLQIYVPLSAKT